VQTCEREGFSVIEKAPDSNIAGVYRRLARSIMTRNEGKIPVPLNDMRLRELTRI
jgi:nitrogenase subunit NifH